MDHQLRGSNKDLHYYLDVLLCTNRLESSTDDLQRDWWWTLLLKTETFDTIQHSCQCPWFYTNQGYKSNLLCQWCVLLLPWFTETLLLPIFLLLLHNLKTLWVVPLNADELEILCPWFSLIHHSEYEASTTVLTFNLYSITRWRWRLNHLLLMS